jgi:very-short-patch-repair endonuclease
MERNGQTHFDFHLTFQDDFEVLVELDGPQHFWVSQAYYTDAGCERDLAKETWAVARGLCVVRVLQEDVWEDRYDWRGWLSRAIAAARTGEARVLVPEDVREYSAGESAYVRLRRS